MEAVIKTDNRKQVNNLDDLPLYDRSLVDYPSYNNVITDAGLKYSMNVQATRGCPYRCFYCDVYKTTLHHYRRSVDSIFEEVKMIADLGVKRIEFIDDIFNVKRKDFVEFFNKVIQHNLKVKFFFPTALKGDLLDKESIDVMMQGGSIGFKVSLESASPRMQKVMRKNLNIEKFRENLEYVCKNYPDAITSVNTMHGFPTETEEEAMMTLNFIKDIKWIHFPYVHVVKIFPGTGLEEFALDHGVARKAINEATDKAYHVVTPTLPFPKEFTDRYKLNFIKNYVFNKERLLKVLPIQMKHHTEEELNQRYGSYFPRGIKRLSDVLKIAKINENELKIKCLDEKEIAIPNFQEKINKKFQIKKKKGTNPVKLLLINISTYFTKDRDVGEYDVLEPPLGLIALLSYLNRELEEKIEGKIIKSKIDFDCYEELTKVIDEFDPDIIGVSAMTFHKKFFHDAIRNIRKHGYDKTIIAGGPYPTASYLEVLNDKNIDLCVLGEGEVTLTEFTRKFIDNKKNKLSYEELTNINGIAFSRSNFNTDSVRVAS